MTPVSTNGKRTLYRIDPDDRVPRNWRNRRKSEIRLGYFEGNLYWTSNRPGFLWAWTRVIVDQLISFRFAEPRDSFVMSTGDK